MLLSSQNLLGAVRHASAHSFAQDADRPGSLAQSLQISLGLLLARERAGVAGLQRQFASVQAPLQQLRQQHAADAGLVQAIDILLAQAAEGAALTQLAAAETAWHQLLEAIEELVQRHGRGQAGQWLALLGQWETADLAGQLDGQAPQPAASDIISAEAWQAYLRARFDEPELALLSFSPLPGGFGKQTYLFAVRGRALDGEFVLRRDPHIPVFDNDCHRIDREYAVIAAVHGRGFPAPDVVWLDTEHALLPGGDFLVMRRAAGSGGGSVFAATGSLSEDFSRLLAGILARLHALPALPELDHAADSINARRWAMPLRDCVQAYLDDWLALYRSEGHLPSPTISALLRWVGDNVPDAPGRPVLLHGDIGFHNLLLDDGRLTAVLDWEFAHLGDPAEDLAYVRNTIGPMLDWEAFMAQYREQGGAEVGPERLLFHQVWGQLRNATAANLLARKFHDGRVDDIKIAILPNLYIPQFLQAACALVAEHQALVADAEVAHG